jgi:radical SAM superfamily enzyme YgiQ (UPF0313 family)
MKVLLISTYDLGRQPFGLASPAAWLRRDGNEVTCVDASRADVQDAQILAADVIAFYLPMHTATRLAEPLLARCRTLNSRARLVAYGLYAPLNAEWLRQRGVSDVVGPEAEADLVALANSQLPTPNSQFANRRGEAGGIPRLAFIQPDRATLPPPSEYAGLHMPDGRRRTVGNTESSRGCKHLCRHCPIVPVYKGAFRVVPVDVVMQDVSAQVAAGAEHISFGDPDFFNGPTHAQRIVERLAADHAHVTYDVTIKIEHLLQHRELLPLLARTGCLFVTSAVESVDDTVLERLAKGHTRTDFEEAVALCRGAGLTLSPTFVAFTPWTTVNGYLDLLHTIARLRLVEDVAPIQLAIRLLVTAGSHLLELEDLRAMVEPFDGASLTYPWRHADPAVDALQRDVMSLVASTPHASRTAAFRAIWTLAHTHGGVVAPPLDLSACRPAAYMSEPWYCCAEPAEFHL